MGVLEDLIDTKHNRQSVRVLTDYINKAIWWVRHRTVDNYTTIKITSLPPGYYDADTRLLHAAFDLLLGFVEGELAWMSFILPEKGEDVRVPWWQTKNRYVKTHAEELAMRYFKWAEEYKDDDTGSGHPKAECHKELRELYMWWKHTRPARLDPIEYWSKNRKSDPQALTKSMAMEDAYDKEDTEQFIRLVKARGAMWT